MASKDNILGSLPDYAKWHWECILRELLRLCPCIADRLHSNLYCLKEYIAGKEPFEGSFVYQTKTIYEFGMKHGPKQDDFTALLKEIKRRGAKLP